MPHFEKVAFDEIEHETDDAVLFIIDDAEVWVPRSLLGGIDSDINVAKIPGWFVEQESLESYIVE